MKFFEAHPELVLISLAFLLLAVIAATFFFDIATLFTLLNQATNAGNGKSTAISFDLQGAKTLNLKGALPR